MAREASRSDSVLLLCRRKPLVIGQGANDPRVKQAEADQIFAAMRAKNLEVKYYLCVPLPVPTRSPLPAAAVVGKRFIDRCINYTAIARTEHAPGTIAVVGKGIPVLSLFTAAQAV